MESNMQGNIITGMSYFLEGFKLITKEGLRSYVIIPLVINILLFSIATWYSVDLFDSGVQWLLEAVPSWLSFIKWILWPIFILTIGTLIFFFSNIVANIVASPFNGLLAEKTEAYLTEQISEEPFRVSELLKVIPESIMRELHKLKYYLPRIIILTLLSIIPGVNIIVFIFAAWMMAIQYIDFPMDNHKIMFNDMLSLIKKRNLSAIGFGGVVMLCLMIPILNFVVIPAAVCGATLFWTEEFKAIEE